MAQRDLRRGERGKFLENWGITKTRASKARAIYRTFAKEQDVSGLSVEEGYEQRTRKRANAPKPKSAKSVGREKEVRALRKFVRFVSKHANKLIDVAGFAEPDDAKALIPETREAIRDLEQLLVHLEHNARTESVENTSK